MRSQTQNMRTLRKVVRKLVRRPSDSQPVQTHSLFYWRPKGGGQNFGDHLSSAIVTKMAAEKGMFLDEIVAAPKRVIAIGSVLHFAEDQNVVWGSGFNASVPLDWHKFGNLDVRAIRGPLTKKFLEDRGVAVPNVFGDPALLTKKLLGMRFHAPERKAPVAFVPNFADLPLMDGWENVVSPYLPWPDVIARIIASEHVIASSLHGLIIADTFGVPCTYIRLSEHEGVFKYEDYCFGAGRERLEITRSKAEALRSSPMAAIKPDLERLYNAFPWDLWS